MGSKGLMSIDGNRTVDEVRVAEVVEVAGEVPVMKGVGDTEDVDGPAKADTRASVETGVEGIVESPRVKATLSDPKCSAPLLMSV